VLNFSEKYRPLFAKPYARDKVNSKGFKKLSKQEQDFWTKVDRANIFILTGGRGSGKSTAVEIDADIRGSEYNHNTYYTRFTNDSLEDTVIKDFEKVFELVDVDRDVLRRRIEYPKGGSIVFKGLKRGSKSQTAGGKGLSAFNCQVIEEAEEHPSFEEFDKMRLSLRRKDLPNYSILLLNPTTKEHWIYKEYFEGRGVPGGTNDIIDNVCYIHTTYLDVDEEHHTKENWEEYKKGEQYYEEYLNTAPDKREDLQPIVKRFYSWYKHVILGGWLDKAEGVVFADWKEGQFDDTLSYCYGMDFGYSPDPTAVCKVAVDNNKKLLYIEEILHKTNLSTDGIYTHLIDVLDDPNALIIGPEG
jgi:phage terminase large subunit